MFRFYINLMVINCYWREKIYRVTGIVFTSGYNFDLTSVTDNMYVSSAVGRLPSMNIGQLPNMNYGWLPNFGSLPGDSDTDKTNSSCMFVDYVICQTGLSVATFSQ